MSGYSKVTVDKVKKTLKATGVSMRMTPVRLRKLASFMTRFLFCWASLFGPDQPQRAHLPSSKAPEPVLSAQRPLSSVTIAPLPLEALLVEGVCVHLLPPILPSCFTHTPFDLRHCYPCLHDMDYHLHALL